MGIALLLIVWIARTIMLSLLECFFSFKVYVKSQPELLRVFFS